MSIPVVVVLMAIGIVVGRVVAGKSRTVVRTTLSVLAVLWVILVVNAFIWSRTVIPGPSLLTPSPWLQFVAWTSLALPVVLQLDWAHRVGRTGRRIRRSMIGIWLALVATCFYFASIAWDVLPLPVSSLVIVPVAILAYVAPVAFMLLAGRRLGEIGQRSATRET
jgi:hypothetical protein